MLNPQHLRILDAAAAFLRTLPFQGIHPSHVQRRALPVAEEKVDALPLIVVAPDVRTGDKPERLNSAYWKVPYKCLSGIIAADNRAWDANLPQYLQWRQTLLTAFRPPRLVGAPEVWSTEVDPEPTFEAAALNASYFYSLVGVTFFTAEPAVGPS